MLTFPHCGNNIDSESKNFSQSLEIMETLNIIANQSDFLAFIKDQAMENGNLSIRGAERCCGVARGALQKALNLVDNHPTHKLGQTLTEKGFTPKEIIENGINLDALALISHYFAFVSKVRSEKSEIIYCKLKGISFTRMNNQQRVSERSEQKLKKQFESEITAFEVKTPLGNIDILTPLHLIEIKHIKGLNSALGQVLCYGSFYPNHDKVILVFGQISNIESIRLAEFRKVARKYKVKVAIINSTKTLSAAKAKYITDTIVNLKMIDSLNKKLTEVGSGYRIPAPPGV